MNKAAVAIFAILFWTLSAQGNVSAQLVRVGYSGTGSVRILQRFIHGEKLWLKRGLDVKHIYFNSGSLMSQAMIGGDIVLSDSDIPAMLSLAVSGILDAKVVAITENKLEHFFVARKNIARVEDLKGKRLAISRFGSASDTVTRMVMRAWKLDPDTDVIILQTGNTPSRIAALVGGSVDGALVSPDFVNRIIATGCCRALADLSELPMDFARYGIVAPAAIIKSNRPLVLNYLAAIAEGLPKFKVMPKEAMAAIKAEGEVGDEIKETYERMKKLMKEDIMPEKKGIQSVLDSLANPKARKISPESLMDTSLLEELKSKGFGTKY
jgi:ABC-type nitrate/sulfonate/bicarbonate transport system substrate-binding protein